MRLSARGKMPVSCAIEVAPTTTSFCMASWMVRTGVCAFQTMPIDTVRDGTADPVELRGLEVRLRQLEQRRQHEAAGDEAPGGAVLRADALDVGRGLDAAGARHVRDDDIGIAGNVFADHLRQRHRIAAHRAAARTGADIHRDGLAAVEVLDGFRPRRMTPQARRAGRQPQPLRYQPLSLICYRRALPSGADRDAVVALGRLP